MRLPYDPRATTASVERSATATADAAGNAVLTWPQNAVDMAMSVTITVDGPSTSPAPIMLSGQPVGFMTTGMSYGPFVIGPGEELSVSFSGAQPGAVFTGSIRGGRVRPGTPQTINPVPIQPQAGGEPASIFGGGTDGDATIGTDTAITRDMQYGNLTIAAGVTLDTAGFVVYVAGTLTLNTGARIGTPGRDGSSGANAPSSTGGAGGAPRASAYNQAPTAGGSGGDGGGSGGFPGNPGSNAGGITATGLDLIGAAGGAGGPGGAGGGAGGASGAGGGLTQTKNAAPATFDPSIATDSMGAGTGGGGGGGGGSQTIGGFQGAGGGGGGAGAGGGQAVVFARNVIGAGKVTAAGGNGGNGGNGFNFASGPGLGGGGGGGAGGAGGLAVLVYSTASGGFTPTNVTASGGTGGTGGTGVNGAANGAAGAAGNNGQAFAIRVTVS